MERPAQQARSCLGPPTRVELPKDHDTENKVGLTVASGKI